LFLKHIFQQQHYDFTAFRVEVIIINTFWLTVLAISAAILDSEQAMWVVSSHPG